MSLINKPKTVEAEETRIHRIRITLSSRNVKNLEKGASMHSGVSCTACSVPRSPFDSREGACAVDS